jgi:single-stranded DNA-binding protein
VGRRGRGGIREPGVVYIEATIYGLAAYDYSEALAAGRGVAVAGRLEQDEWRDESGERRSRTWVAVDQLDLL